MRNNKVLVSFFPPKTNLKAGKFVMPKLVPGYYDAMNFGQYISASQAFNNNGEPVAVNRLTMRPIPWPLYIRYGLANSLADPRQLTGTSWT